MAPSVHGHVLGGLQGQVVAQLLAVLPGRGEQPRRVAGVAHAAAQHELDGGQAPAEPQPPDPAADQRGGQRGGR